MRGRANRPGEKDTASSPRRRSGGDARRLRSLYKVNDAPAPHRELYKRGIVETRMFMKSQFA
jgi:hypothetical protein